MGWGPTNFENSRAGPTTLIFGAVGFCLVFFSLLSFLSSFSLSRADGPLLIEILSQRAVERYTTNPTQPLNTLTQKAKMTDKIYDESEMRTRQKQHFVTPGDP